MAHPNPRAATQTDGRDRSTHRARLVPTSRTRGGDVEMPVEPRGGAPRLPQVWSSPAAQSAAARGSADQRLGMRLPGMPALFGTGSRATPWKMRAGMSLPRDPRNFRPLLFRAASDPDRNRSLLDSLKRWRFFPRHVKRDTVASSVDIRLPGSVKQVAFTATGATPRSTSWAPRPASRRTRGSSKSAVRGPVLQLQTPSRLVGARAPRRA